ncbi:hypothetical protein OF001_U110025 [Pseudomonas sp. OF001]|nr:hypothetical protein OF001_U110025 [Pseudomonas sp. OF001]
MPTLPAGAAPGSPPARGAHQPAFPRACELDHKTMTPLDQELMPVKHAGA